MCADVYPLKSKEAVFVFRDAVFVTKARGTAPSISHRRLARLRRTVTERQQQGSKCIVALHLSSQHKHLRHGRPRGGHPAGERPRANKVSAPVDTGGARGVAGSSPAMVRLRLNRFTVRNLPWHLVQAGGAVRIAHQDSRRRPSRTGSASGTSGCTANTMFFCTVTLLVVADQRLLRQIVALAVANKCRRSGGRPWLTIHWLVRGEDVLEHFAPGTSFEETR